MKTILIILLSLFQIADKPDTVIIKQESGTRFPCFGYHPIKDKVMRVEFPIEFTIENPTDIENRIMMVDYRCISGYWTERLGWWGVALFEDRGDTLISVTSQQGIEYIYPNDKRHYIIFTEHTVYNDTLFHRIFQKEISKMKSSDNFMNPDTFTPLQMNYLKGMLSKDSLRIEIADDKVSRWFYLPIDVNKVMPLHTERNKHSEILKTIRDEGIE